MNDNLAFFYFFIFLSRLVLDQLIKVILPKLRMRTTTTRIKVGTVDVARGERMNSDSHRSSIVYLSTHVNIHSGNKM